MLRLLFANAIAIVLPFLVLDQVQGLELPPAKGVICLQDQRKAGMPLLAFGPMNFTEHAGLGRVFWRSEGAFLCQQWIRCGDGAVGGNRGAE